jgi:hypothetical protein
VSVSRQEIAVVFGSRQAGRPDHAKKQVRADTRIILSPLAAKRLLAALQRHLGEHQAASRPFAAAASDAGVTFPAVLHPPAFHLPLSTRTAAHLLELLAEIGTGAQYERSFKLLDGTLLANRLLLAIEKQAIPGEPEARVLDVCQRLGMSEAGLGLFRTHLAEADVVGFALEEDESTCLIKAYLEFRRRYAEARRKTRDKGATYLSHLGVKWDVEDPGRSVLGQYVCFPALTADDMLERVAESHYRSRDGEALAVVRGIAELAVRRVGQDKLLYLEATEEGTPRASFDINLYSANLQMREVSRFLSTAFRYYGIPEGQSRRLSESMQDGTVGHVAGGTDRRGREFLTIYFEE